VRLTRQGDDNFQACPTHNQARAIVSTTGNTGHCLEKPYIFSWWAQLAFPCALYGASQYATAVLHKVAPPSPGTCGRPFVALVDRPLKVQYSPKSLRGWPSRAWPGL
jgi:hypothetical protein